MKGKITGAGNGMQCENKTIRKIYKSLRTVFMLKGALSAKAAGEGGTDTGGEEREASYVSGQWLKSGD